MNTVIEESVEE
jgi:hypothetical protein